MQWAMDGRIVRCGIITSCQSAATSEIVKRFWSRCLTHVRDAIAITRPLPLPLRTGPYSTVADGRWRNLRYRWFDRT